MFDFTKEQAEQKRDKTITLRASNNDLQQIDGLIKKLKISKKVPVYYKYSRMDLIIDACKSYEKQMFPEKKEIDL